MKSHQPTQKRYRALILLGILVMAASQGLRALPGNLSFLLQGVLMTLALICLFVGLYLYWQERLG